MDRNDDQLLNATECLSFFRENMWQTAFFLLSKTEDNNCNERERKKSGLLFFVVIESTTMSFTMKFNMFVLRLEENRSNLHGNILSYHGGSCVLIDLKQTEMNIHHQINNDRNSILI